MGSGVLRFFCLVLLCGAVRAQLVSISGGDTLISAGDILTPATTNTLFGNPLQPPELAPLNQRVLRFFWDSPTLAADPIKTAANVLRFTFAGTPPAFVAVKLEAPWLELDVSANPHARCEEPVVGSQYPYLPAASKDITAGCAPVGGTNVVQCTLSNAMVSTYFTHPPYPNQNPFMRTYRKICVQVTLPGGAGNKWIDTNVWFAVEHSCDAQQNTNGVPTLTHNCNNWPDALTHTINAGVVTTTTATTNPTGNIGVFLTTAGTAVAAVAQPSLLNADQFGETPEMKLDRLSRRQCCGAAPDQTLPWTGAAAGLKYGVCINTLRTSCCGWRPYAPNTEKCCSKRTSQITWHDRRCPCTVFPTTTVAAERAIEVRDCQMAGPNSFASITDGRGSTDAPNTNNRCCASTVYTELLNTQTAGGPVSAVARSGWCYDTTVERCCNVDGAVFDAGSQQCCSVNGVQSINEPCPCNLDSQCGTGKRCCMQTFPPAISVNRFPDAATGNANQCHVYANFPTGSAPAYAMNCAGRCYSTAFQICCNGQVCVREYDKCCNATCCNRHTSSCMDGYQQGTTGAGRRINALNFRVPYEICSEVENLTARRTLFVFVFPTMFLLATLISLAIVTILARRATEHYFDLIEQGMVFCATVITLLACGFYFSPCYKYGVVITFMGLFAIITAVIRRLAYSVILCFVIVVLILFLVDPFAGNIYLSFSSGVPPTGGAPLGSDMTNVGPGYYRGPPIPLSHSLFEALARLIAFPFECTSFYDWFQFDATARDFARMQNPAKQTFGYCTRAWLSTLVIFLIFIVLLTLVLFSLSMMSLVKKLAPPRGDDVIQLEVKRGADVYAD